MSEEKKIYAPGNRCQSIKFQRGRRYEVFVYEDGSFNAYDLGPATAADEAAVKSTFPQVMIDKPPFELDNA